MTDRAVWGTRKYRAADLQVGDVIRDAYGKWDKVTAVKKMTDTYVRVEVEHLSYLALRNVALVDVQYAKPS